MFSCLDHDLGHRGKRPAGSGLTPRQVPSVPPGFHTGCIAGCTVLTCSCTKPDIYLSSTHYFGYPAACWKYNMYDGDQYAGDCIDPHKVRLVRTAS